MNNDNVINWIRHQSKQIGRFRLQWGIASSTSWFAYRQKNVIRDLKVVDEGVILTSQADQPASFWHVM